MARRDKRIDEILAAAERQGWRVRLCGSGHYQLRSPSGRIVVISQTASDHRWYHNAMSHLRRTGEWAA